VHSLTSEQAARGYPVHLRAVVTNLDPDSGDGYLALFARDASGGIYVRAGHDSVESLRNGSLVDVRGISGPGEYAPIVAEPRIKVIGFSGLPANPERPSMTRLLTGAEDGQWVEVEGIVHSVFEGEHHTNLKLETADAPITVVMVKEEGQHLSRFIDAEVRIRGNAAPLFDVSRRHMIGANIHCPGLSAVDVVRPAPADPFTQPTIPVYRLLQWDTAPLLAHRVHVQGRVSLVWPGTSVCIRDGLQGICAQTDQKENLRNGELIDIAGFVSAEGGAPAMSGAEFRSSGSPFAVPIAATPVTPEKALLGNHEFQLVQIEGQLVSRDLASADTVLLITSGKFVFTAILPQALGSPDATAWKNGSVLRVTGICSVQLDPERSAAGMGTAVPKTFRILMRSPSDVVVIQKPSWWTPTHALVLLAFGFTATLAVLAWVVVLRKHVQQQADLLRESEGLFRHMALHDALTGLASRVLLQDRLNVALESARRHRTGLAVLMVDLDKFKDVNDTFGHQAGDEVLRVTANRILRAVRKADTVARLGGDEFVVLLPELTDLQALEKIAANIVESLAVPISFAGREMPVTVSVGVCPSGAEELDADTLLRNADSALYQAKASGRNRFQLFTPDTPPALAAEPLPASRR